MAEDTQSRRLTTIVALDVAGYSARTEIDEARTTAEVAALRSMIEGIAGPRGGRVFSTAGDGFMLECAGIAFEATLRQPRQVRNVCGHVSLRTRPLPGSRVRCGQDCSEFLGNRRVGRAENRPSGGGREQRPWPGTASEQCRVDLWW